MQCFALLKSAGSNLEDVPKSPRKKGEVEMHIALGVSFGMIVAAPFIGRWRANVWLKNHLPAEREMKSIPEIA
jgi:hypothetical protein